MRLHLMVLRRLRSGKTSASCITTYSCSKAAAASSGLVKALSACSQRMQGCQPYRGLTANHCQAC